MTAHGPKKGSRNANALAMVAGALIALIGILAFLALLSHRGGAQETGASAAVFRAAMLARPQLTVSVWAVAS